MGANSGAGPHTKEWTRLTVASSPGSSYVSRDATLYHCTAEIPVQGPSEKEEREGEPGTLQSPGQD